VQGRKQKNLVLILAREFASTLATPVFVADAEGNLVFYNEPAEIVLGQPFAEAGEMPAERWADIFRLERLDGSPLPLDEIPAGVALLERREAHAEFRLTGLDGVRRDISATALPLFARDDQLVGVVALFWEHA
jgi:PAS domain-containing protein